MKNHFPFTDYDFWAYLTSGFAFIFVCDHIFQTDLMAQADWTLAQAVFVSACAYVVGHLLAGVASALLERRVVRGWLGTPTALLFAVVHGPSWFRRLYPSYYQPLPAKTRAAILQKAAGAGVTSPGEDLFWVAFEAARVNKAAFDRMTVFLDLYGLCRNIAMTAAIAATLLAINAWRSQVPADYEWAGVAGFIAVGMFLRYLKFYRHYSLELFTSYAYASEK